MKTMTKQEAIDLEIQLGGDDQNATVRREGTLKITNGDGRQSTVHALFAAADVIKLLDSGHSMTAVVAMLERMAD